MSDLVKSEDVSVEELDRLIDEFIELGKHLDDSIDDDVLWLDDEHFIIF